MKEIKQRSDIEFIVDAFYKKVIADGLLGPLFSDIFKLDFEKHKPIMCDFWETTLLENFVYQGNPLFKHLALEKFTPLKEEYFTRWIYLWESTINKDFNGDKAEMAIQRAKVMGHVILSKVKEAENNKFL